MKTIFQYCKPVYSSQLRNPLHDLTSSYMGSPLVFTTTCFLKKLQKADGCEENCNYKTSSLCYITISYLYHKSIFSLMTVIELLLLLLLLCPVGWGCRIHWLHLCRGLRLPNEYPGYDLKQSDGEVPVMLELWGMQSTPSLPLLPGPLWLGMVAPDRALSMG